MHNDLLEKQANIEQKYAEEKKAQEQITKEKIGEYEMTIALMKSKFIMIEFILISLFLFLGEYMVDMENTKLDHDQAILRLKNELQQANASSKQLFIFI